MSRIVLLGPQRLRPSVGRVVESLGLKGPVATITAGWEERESEDEELNAALACPVTNLRLFQRAELVFRKHPDLLERVQRQHDRLRRIQELYRVRLGHTVEAARALIRMEGDRTLIDPQRRSAFEAIRVLDAEHLERKTLAQLEFAQACAPMEYEAVRVNRREIADILRDSEAVAIAGGHVAVLKNRLWLFDLASSLPDRTLIAWSAGAMVLADRIVLFHDQPAVGQGNAEVFEPGLGFYSGVVPLPHARRRLQLDDRARTMLLARRFAPARCVIMDDGCRMDWRDGAWNETSEMQEITPEGEVVSMTRGEAPCPR